MTHKGKLPANAPATGIYKHYKGNLYQVFGMTQHSETDEWMVVYQALYGEYGFWVRPLSIWLEPVASNPLELDQNPENEEAPPADNRKTRFQLVTPMDVSLTQLTNNKLY